jgi:hypothetical protein
MRRPKIAQGAAAICEEQARQTVYETPELQKSQGSGA